MIWLHGHPISHFMLPNWYMHAIEGFRPISWKRTQLRQMSGIKNMPRFNVLFLHPLL
jgi:hypothetical protein